MRLGKYIVVATLLLSGSAIVQSWYEINRLAYGGHKSTIVQLNELTNTVGNKDAAHAA